MSTTIERLRALARSMERPGVDPDDAADLSALLAWVEDARKGLEPFGTVARFMQPLVDVAPERWPDDKPNSEFIPGAWPTWGDFRNAAALLARLEGK